MQVSCDVPIYQISVKSSITIKRINILFHSFHPCPLGQNFYDTCISQVNCLFKYDTPQLPCNIIKKCYSDEQQQYSLFVDICNEVEPVCCTLTHLISQIRILSSITESKTQLEYSQISCIYQHHLLLLHSKQKAKRPIYT